MRKIIENFPLYGRGAIQKVERLGGEGVMSRLREKENMSQDELKKMGSDTM